MTMLFHVSDLHFGYEDRAALDWFAQAVEQVRPAAVICTGDLTMRGTAREFAMAEQWLGALPVPVSIEPGNHDVPYYHHMVQRLTRPYARFDALKAAVGQEIVFDDLAVIPMQTVARAQFRINWSKGRVGAPALGSALQGLDQHRGRAVKLVACHHPLVGAQAGGRTSTRGGAQALTALAQAGATAVLSGHVHDAFDRTLELSGQTIRLIGAGTLSQRLRATRPSYNRIEVDQDGALAVTVEQLA